MTAVWAAAFFSLISTDKLIDCIPNATYAVSLESNGMTEALVKTLERD
ncbi:hypothetical protein GCM10011488_68340 [Steroidobacter agaridevorans]|nr:hypothetical protein GCM10011488_68340 [Steroidobacter agaridevorans]